MNVDYVHAALNWVSYNRGLVASVIIGAVLSLVLLSCVPKTQSIMEPGKKVTATELEREVLQAQADFRDKTDKAVLAQADLARQYELRQQVVGIIGSLGTTISTGGLSTGAAVGGVLQLLTLFGLAGAVYDNRRKDTVIAAKSAELATSATTKAPG